MLSEHRNGPTSQRDWSLANHRDRWTWADFSSDSAFDFDGRAVVFGFEKTIFKEHSQRRWEHSGNKRVFKSTGPKPVPDGPTAPPGGGGNMNMLLYYLAPLIKNLRASLDDDFADQLNHYYTTSILMLFSLLVTAKQYVGQPLQCWVPATFTDAMEQYTENYCWVQSTYWVAIPHSIPSSVSHRSALRIGYYQWAGFILALEALMFYIPCVIWRGLLYWRSSTNLEGLIQLAREARVIDPELKNRPLRTICAYLEDRFRLRYGTEKSTCCGVSANIVDQHCGFWICVLYISVKLIYCCNVICQFMLLNHFLGTRSIFFGFQILNDLLREDSQYSDTANWDSHIFPRVTLCDFQVRVLGNIHRHTVQCVLMINMFNEKIFLFLWFWFLLVTVTTLFNTAHWIFLLFSPGQGRMFVKRYLNIMSAYPGKTVVEQHMLEKFVNKFLQKDGVFVLRMVSAHAGEIVLAELILNLWNSYSKMERSCSTFWADVNDVSPVLQSSDA